MPATEQQVLTRFFRKIGASGGKQAAKNMSARQRRERALKAIHIRWANYRANQSK
ncbi:MAG TPA: hypothetical protein VFQ43_13320 [Nitrososphaera sp.]|nr:hypothetical protein [Nitrososphaera sp.]